MLTTSMDGTVFTVRIDETMDLNTEALPRSVNADRHPGFGFNRASLLDLLEQGWAEGLEKVERLSEQLQRDMAPPVSFRRRQVWSDDGDEASWEREAAGHDDCWRTARRKSQRGPAVIELAASWGGRAIYSDEQLIWNGVALAVLCNLLEQSGYRVGASLNNASTYFNTSNISHIQIVVKRPEMPLDLASLVPVASHPGMFRLFGLEIKTLAPFRIDSGLGCTDDLSILPDGTFAPTVIKLAHCYSEASARAEISRVLALFAEPAAATA